MPDDSTPWPTELRLKNDKKTLVVSFDDGASYDLSAEYLRVSSPSAEVQGHSPDQRKTVPGKRNVEIMTLDPVGNYAVRITFDDMHNTGIFSWVYLERLGEEHAVIWGDYLDELDRKNLSRDR